MPLGATLDTTKAPNYPSPLWIIALFIALCEVMAGVAAIATDGATRMIFATFAIVFPFVVLGVFVWLLLKHPANLYSPSQYTTQTSIETYTAALSRQNRANSIVYSHAIGEAIASATAGDAPAGSPFADEWRARITEAIDRRVERSSITIDRSGFLNGAEPVQIPVTAETSVGELLDSTYFEIAPAVEPYTYAKSWILTDQDGTPLDKIGTQWAYRDGRSRDERPLAQVGIVPGSTLSLRHR